MWQPLGICAKIITCGILEKLKKKDNYLLTKRTQTQNPRLHRLHIVEACHPHMRDLKYIWSKMYQDISQRVRTCSVSPKIKTA